MSKAFVGISLDSGLFSRAWVRRALEHLAVEHEQILLVLADELFMYTRAAYLDEAAVAVDIPQAHAAADALAGERQRFFEREIARLGEAAGRFRLVRWSVFSDAAYATLWRKLWLSYSVLPDFRDQVDAVAAQHTKKAVLGPRTPDHAQVSAAYILDEIAMCIRVTELEGYCHEYHPGPDLPVAQALFAGQFRHLGLSVDLLTGAVPRRSFTVLYEEQALQKTA
jgi:tRNA-dependent cyclodipeptide synthase